MQKGKTKSQLGIIVSKQWMPSSSGAIRTPVILRRSSDFFFIGGGDDFLTSLPFALLPSLTFPVSACLLAVVDGSESEMRTFWPRYSAQRASKAVKIVMVMNSQRFWNLNWIEMIYKLSGMCVIYIRGGNRNLNGVEKVWKFLAFWRGYQRRVRVNNFRISGWT